MGGKMKNLIKVFYNTNIESTRLEEITMDVRRKTLGFSSVQRMKKKKHARYIKNLSK